MAVYDINRILVPDAPPEYEDHTRDVHYVPAPCQVACPIGTDAPSYIAHIWDEDYEAAFEAITSTNPFSSICGRVCDAPCEPACRRVDSDGAVQIRNLKRFVMDKLGATWRPPAAPVTRSQSIGIVGAGPAGLVAAHDLCVAGYAVHVYEMTDRLGGMMIWGIPAFRLPPGIIDEDVDRLMQRCPGLEVHLDTALGRDVSLEELKERHDAVLLTIGAWWGKPMGIAGEEDERVVDGVGFLRRVNAGERPEMPETVVVVGGGDVAMDACRVAKRLPGCKHVKVIYRRGPGEIPARKIELHHAIKEDVEFLYHTQQVAVIPRGNQLALKCVKTALGEPDDDGRRRPVAIEGSEHEILCGSVIAAVGQRSICEELHRADMMAPDRVRTEWDSMRTSDPMVFAAGDGAFGGSTLVMAMQHGQRAAYYLRHFLEGNREPAALSHALPHPPRAGRPGPHVGEVSHPGAGVLRTGRATGRVSRDRAHLRHRYRPGGSGTLLPLRRGDRLGRLLGAAPRGHLLDGPHRSAQDAPKLKAMLDRRLRLRENPFPQERPACLDDLVFLPANLSRLVIDPYREACKIGWRLGERLDLDIPFFVAGFDTASEELKVAVDRGVVAAGAAYLGATRPGPNAPWLQLCEPGRDAPSHDAAGVVYRVGERWHPMPTARACPSKSSAFSSAHAVIWRTRSSTRSSAASTCWCSTARALSAVSGRSSAPPPTSPSSARPSRPCDA